MNARASNRIEPEGWQRRLKRFSAALVGALLLLNLFVLTVDWLTAGPPSRDEWIVTFLYPATVGLAMLYMLGMTRVLPLALGIGAGLAWLAIDLTLGIVLPGHSVLLDGDLEARLAHALVAATGLFGIWRRPSDQDQHEGRVSA